MGSTGNGEESANITKFGFQCRCARCENNDPNEQLQPEQSAETLPRSSQFVERRRGNRLLPVSRQSLSYDAFQVCTCHGDVARAKVFASLAVDAKRVWNGTDSCELPQKEELARRPESHRLAFQTKKWSSAGSSSSSSKLAASLQQACSISILG